MKVNKNQIISITNVSRNTWEKSNKEKKERFIYGAGYKLIDTFKVGREAFYEIEPINETLVEIIKFLRENDLPIRENSMKFIDFLVMIDSDNSCQINSIAKELDVNQTTIFRWRKALIEKNIINYNNKALPARFKEKTREIIEEDDFDKINKERKRLQDSGLSFIEADNYITNLTGYRYRRVGKSARNGFYEDFFHLLNQLED